MPKTIGYSVISDLEEGFLVQTAPSVWHFSIDSAIRYETEKEAWAAANRRKFALAAPVRIIEDDEGTLDYERLESIVKAKGGSWIVKVTLERPADRIHYLMSAGKKITISTSRQDAKGYTTEGAAQRAADMVSSSPTMKAQIERVTAEIVAFPVSGM